jgi:hypothetical protein
MDRIHNALPTGESLFTMNIRNAWITAGRDVIDTGALGHNQTHTTRRTPSVVLDIAVVGCVVRRLVPSHGCHNDTIVKLKTTYVDRTQERVMGTHVKNLVHQRAGIIDLPIV